MGKPRCYDHIGTIKTTTPEKMKCESRLDVDVHNSELELFTSFAFIYDHSHTFAGFVFWYAMHIF